MESRYKERAIELKLEYLKKWEDSFDNSNGDMNKLYDFWIEDAMCQLAEEARESTLNNLTDNMKVFADFFKNASTIYTKEQVEELLQKQRELSAEKARIDWFEVVSDEKIEQKEEHIETKSVVMPDYSNDIFRININSILNAKLKID